MEHYIVLHGRDIKKKPIKFFSPEKLPKFRASAKNFASEILSDRVIANYTSNLKLMQVINVRALNQRPNLPPDVDFMW